MFVLGNTGVIQMAKAPKKRQKPTQVLINLVTILLLATIGALAVPNLARVNKDCKTVVEQSSALINNKDYKKAFNQLTPHQASCGKAVAKSDTADDKIAKLNFHSRLAVAAYVVGEKELATAEADEGLRIMRKELTDKQAQSVRGNYVSDLVFVKSDLY